jgi:rubredoxin
MLPKKAYSTKFRPSCTGVDAMSSDLKKWQCIACGFIYDEAAGDVQEGIPPGTRWADLPEDWTCPSCGAAKSDFLMMEIT